jgi:phage shock protein B
MPFLAAGIILLSALVIAVIVGFVMLVVALLRKLLRSQDQANSGEEARLLQDMNEKLNKLEKRIESLETIVVASEPHNPKA